MAAPPPKRQRKLVVLSSSDNEDETLSLGDNINNNINKGPEGKLVWIVLPVGLFWGI
jgi:hypothetical protein